MFFDFFIEFYPCISHSFFVNLLAAKVLIDKMELIVAELGKFTHVTQEVISELDKLLLTMKNAHTIDISISR